MWLQDARDRPTSQAGRTGSSVQSEGASRSASGTAGALSSPRETAVARVHGGGARRGPDGLTLSAHQEPASEAATSSSRSRGGAGSRRLGVRGLLFVALGASAIVPVGLLGFDQAGRWAASELASSDRQALGAARAASEQLSLAMLEYVHAAESFSAQIGNAGGLDRAGLEAALKAHLAHHPEFFGAYVADVEGRSVLWLNETGWAPGGVDYSDRDYYREVQRTGRAAISRVHVGRTTGVLTVQVAAPIYDATGTRLGMTCSSVDLEAITEQAKQSVVAMREGRLMLIDGDGRRIADSSATTRLTPEDVSRLPLFAMPSGAAPELRAGQDDLGREVRGYALRSKPPVTGWHVLALTPKSVIDTQARQVERQTTALVLALGLSALLVAAALAAWLARPVRALAAGALAVTRGDYDSLPELPPNAPREMAQLARAVRTMIERLRSHSRDLERQVEARTAELSRANADISAALDTIQRHEQRRNADLDKARLFQAKLLPALPQRSDLSIAAHYAPLDQVGGDIYDVTELDDGRLRLFMADATGHGVQASMRTLLLKSAYDRLKARCATPSELLSQLNAHLVGEFPDGDLHCGACCIDLEPGPSGIEVRYANAGSAPIYVFSAQSAAWERYTEGPLLGVDDVSWPEPSRFALPPGQLLVIASDGLSEQPDRLRQRFDSRLLELDLGSAPDASAALGLLLADFRAFLDGHPAQDDITIIVVAVPKV